MAKMTKRRRLAKRAAKLPGWARDYAATKAYGKRGGAQQRFKSRGSFGAASEVRRIDPKDYDGDR